MEHTTIKNRMEHIMKNTTNQNTNTTATNNVITLSKLGEFLTDYATGNKNLSLTKACLMETVEMLQADADRLLNFIEKFYSSIAYMMDLRQAGGKTGNDAETLEELRNAEKAVKNNADVWFIEVGTRPAKKGKVDKDGEPKFRPAYGTTYADYAIFGECVGQAILKAEGDPNKVIGIFFEILALNTAKILNGEKMGRVSEAEFKKARAEFNKQKAEKAAQTRAENAKNQEEKETELEKAKAENEGLKAEIEELKKNVIDTAELINMIIASSATEEEKSAIIDFITGTKA